MFYNQPLTHRFGRSLSADLESGQWRNIEIAVAWVRRSGTKYIAPSIRKFLQDGGVAQITVGIDIENTSQEGLTDLLSLQTEGNLETYVHHNESDATFHPKVYLFRNDQTARLIVGSNNLTEAGLLVNTEAGLQLDARLDDKLITDVRTALATWRDPRTGFAKKLDATLLNDLLRLGYVLSEQTLRRRRTANNDRSRQHRHAPGQALFRAQRIARPPVRPLAMLPANVPGMVLLMRVRRASETARRTQIQLPIRKMHTDFFQGITELVSGHTGQAHRLIEARARGVLNTIKVEIPEIDQMVDPVLRLERMTDAIVYQAFDSTSVLGTPIHQAMLTGFMLSPPATQKTVSAQSRATWWRFV